ncbi:MAG: N-acetylmuramoyl-L-alanine amidase [Bryobacteraceae bacterium]
MRIEWTPCHASNFRAGRPGGHRPEAIVLHSSPLPVERILASYRSPSGLTSAHYIVGRDGAIRQCVQETDTAFHAGIVLNPTWPGLKPRVNPNFYTIAVEHECAPGERWPYAASAALIAGIARRWDIPIDRAHIVLHSAIRSSRKCPDADLDLDVLLRGARDHSAGSALPRVTQVRTIANANLRIGAPRTGVPVLRVLPAGAVVDVHGFTPAGERVRGNSFWYETSEGAFLWAGATDTPEPEADSEASTDEMELRRRSAEPDSAAALAINRERFRLSAHRYVQETTAKDLIVLHFTAGRTAESAFRTWEQQPQRIATSYIVDSDATIYEVFDPTRWASHLGIKGTHRHDRRSIGIELANVGPLKLGPDQQLRWWPNDWRTPYCRLDETARYVRSPYRGIEYFAVFPEAQRRATASLVRHLCERFSIPAEVPPRAKRAAFDMAHFAGFSGVATHANFRADKWDIGPAFDWDELGL